MCTSISFTTDNHYFGRTLDLEYSFDEKVVITPRRFPFQFHHQETNKNHYAIIGMATIVDDYPLYYDAANENGLAIAGLNFPDRAIYNEPDDEKNNICSFEVIPWILSNCETVDEAKALLQKTNIVKGNFNGEYKATPLHWMISDKTASITVESVSEGLKIYYNPVGVLTNNPDFPLQVFNLNNYMSLSAEDPETHFADCFDFNKYSRGMGALGLPGDNSSMSRFVRCAFSKLNSKCDKNEGVTQFFHILGTVNQVRGTVKVNDKFVETIYSSCCNTDKGIYYYKTYANSHIAAINMHNENLSAESLIKFDLIKEQEINFIN